VLLRRWLLLRRRRRRRADLPGRRQATQRAAGLRLRALQRSGCPLLQHRRVRQAKLWQLRRPGTPLPLQLRLQCLLLRLRLQCLLLRLRLQCLLLRLRLQCLLLALRLQASAWLRRRRPLRCRRRRRAGRRAPRLLCALEVPQLLLLLQVPGDGREEVGHLRKVAGGDRGAHADARLQELPGGCQVGAHVAAEVAVVASQDRLDRVQHGRGAAGVHVAALLVAQRVDLLQQLEGLLQRRVVPDLQWR
jgi:hypothetical protein